MYVTFIFIAIFIGYSIGTAPIIGYHYGAENIDEMKNIFKKSMSLITGAGMILTIAAILCSPVLSHLFVGYDIELYEMTDRGFKLYSISFLFSGFSIYGSSLFTALNNGIVSAIISFLRTLVFQVAAILIFPKIWGLDGIWYSIIVAEAAAMFLSFVFIVKMRKRYKYL